METVPLASVHKMQCNLVYCLAALALITTTQTLLSALMIANHAPLVAKLVVIKVPVIAAKLHGHCE
jgi:hypothetical protein